MTLLFHSNVVLDGKKSDYNVYRFKLYPSKYKAELIASNLHFPIKEIIFWKTKHGWKTSLKSKDSQYLADVLGNEIEQLKN